MEMEEGKEKSLYLKNCVLENNHNKYLKTILFERQRDRLSSSLLAKMPSAVSGAGPGESWVLETPSGSPT